MDNSVDQSFTRRFYGLGMRIRPTILVVVVKSLLRIRRIVIENSIGKFYIDPLSHMGQGLWNDRFEPSVRQIIQTHLKTGDIFVDIGANEGYYTIIASGIVEPKGRVIAVEPQNRLIPIIEENARLNNRQNVTIVNVAISDGSNAAAEIWLSPSTMTGSSSLVSRYFIASKQTVTCKTLTEIFDEQQIETADLIKVDVEGFEPEVLKGAAPLLQSRRIRQLFVDYHQSILVKREIDPHSLHSFMIEMGYYTENGKFEPSGYNLYIPDAR